MINNHPHSFAKAASAFADNPDIRKFTGRMNYWDAKGNLITVATSIAPRNIEKQRVAVMSWVAAGLRIISVNTPEEIELLKTSFPKFCLFQLLVMLLNF